MGVARLQTKLRNPPLRGEQVERPHLVERLNAATRERRPLMLLSAPAGSGKTTLLSRWIAQSAYCVTWLSLG